MSANNPLMPQGSLQESKPRNKSNVFITVFAIVAFHVVLLGALLLQGCNNPNKNVPPGDTNLVVIPPLDIPTNLPIPDLTAVPPPVSPAATGLTPGLAPLVPPPAVPATVIPVTPPAVTPPAAVDITITGDATEHAIASGETFAIVAKKYGVSVNAISKANPGVDSRRLKIGQKIKIPERSGAATISPAVVVPDAMTGVGTISPSTPSTGGSGTTKIYVVKKGDTLTKVAKTSGTTINKIKALNGMKTTTLKAGQKLKIPAKTAAAETAPAPGTVMEPAPLSPPPVPVLPGTTGYVTPLPSSTTRRTASL